MSVLVLGEVIPASKASITDRRLSYVSHWSAQASLEIQGEWIAERFKIKEPDSAEPGSFAFSHWPECVSSDRIALILKMFLKR